MADNTTLNTGTGGDTIATDDIAGVKFQRVKIVIGADGTNDGDISAANPIPVTGNNGQRTTLSSSYTVASIKAALPAGTNAIGKLAANSGVDIGDVDVTSVIPGTGATNLGKAADAVAGATDTGVAPLAIRDDALATLTPVDGDYAPLRLNSVGALWVKHNGAETLSSSYTMIAVGRAAHDAAVAGNPLLQGFEARTTNPTAVADGDAVRARADDIGRLVVTPHQVRDLVTEIHLTSMSASTTQTLLAAGAAGVFHDLTAIILSNFSASVANVIIYDGVAAGTARFRFDLAADGGGAVINFAVPFRQAAAATAWAIKSTELDVAVTVQAVKNV